MTTPVIGVVGGGQLARMMQQAAIGLGVPLKLLGEAPDVSAAQVVPNTVVGDYTDLPTLRNFAAGCDVVTFDHEHVPTDALHVLEGDGVVLRPGPGALVHAQDKAVMRRRLDELGVPCPRHRLVASVRDVEELAEEAGWPLVLKRTRGGYDGRGVWFVDDSQSAADVLGQVQQPLLAEERIDFRRELAALVARSASGQAALYPVVESVQRDGICVEVTAPAPRLDGHLAVAAQQIAARIAGELGVVGVLAVELFETPDGRVLVNELAMRPHNTGHWSIDGAVTGQFENHLRAVLDLPLGFPRARQRWTVMANILGGDVPDLYAGYPHVFARDPSVRVHLYGKDVKPGRKVGHVTAYGDDLDDVRERARQAAAWFRGDAGFDEAEQP